jgi:hypothetical protein
MTGGAHLSTRRGDRQRQLMAGALSYGGGKNRVGHQRSTQTSWTGRGR